MSEGKNYKNCIQKTPKTNPLKVCLVDIAPKESGQVERTNRLIEIENLIDTYGGFIVVEKIQKRDTPDYQTYIGSGKLQEIICIGKERKADILVIGNILKPLQIWNISEQLQKEKSGMQAWDRIDLILKIFEQHAGSTQARLQIELAAIRHMGPRIFGMGMELSRQGGGGGGGGGSRRGIGETNTEIMKRHLRKKEHQILEKLKKYENMRENHRLARKKKNLKTIGIVGYTNAGKSCLMNTLSQKGVYVQDELFATLDTRVGKIFLPNKEDLQGGREVLIHDTIGFIRDLPPDLIQAFSSTLEDSILSDLLLHVIDASDPEKHIKIQVVDSILENIHAHQKRLIIFNKIDLISLEEQECLKQEFSYLKPLFISAEKKENIDLLKQQIFEKLFKTNLLNRSYAE